MKYVVSLTKEGRAFAWGLELVTNKFGKFTSMAINGTYFRLSWYISFLCTLGVM